MEPKQQSGAGDKTISHQVPYHLVFVKASILLSIGLYMALSGFLAYMFIKTHVDTNVEDMEKKAMERFLYLLALFFFSAEIILFFGFVGVSKQNYKMSLAFAFLMTLLTIITLTLRAPTAIVFTGLITGLSWWYVALLRKVFVGHVASFAA
ncbi:hypothetical protein HDE_01549 [Halotydeus destructor]|nr:hypothetical protein HDE_01549 [Halotydeus destructor]